MRENNKNVEASIKDILYLDEIVCKAIQSVACIEAGFSVISENLFELSDALLSTKEGMCLNIKYAQPFCDIVWDYIFKSKESIKEIDKWIKEQRTQGGD